MNDANTLQNLYNLTNELFENQIDIVIFGGWAAEIIRSEQPRKHKDIDLLILDDDFNSLVQYAENKKWNLRKSYTHKKAYMLGKVLVEFFLVKKYNQKYITQFVGKDNMYIFLWPDNLFLNIDKTKVATSESQEKYRKEHQLIHKNSEWI